MNPEPLPPAVLPGVAKAPSAKIIGVGGAGLQAVQHMARCGVGEAALAVLHTDARLLGESTVADQLLLGTQLTRGLKVGEPELGRAVAEAEAHRLRHLCEGADLVIVVAGLGGSTASGAAPVLARVARENGALVLALVALPFDFEGRRRQQQAQAALTQLRTAADAVICLPNQKVATLIDEQTSLPEALAIIDDLLAQGVRGLLRLVQRGGLLNVDFSDLCHVVRGRQAESYFATAEAAGESRAREVIERLVRHPLLDDGRLLAEADAVLVSLNGGPGLSLKEVNQVMEQINRLAENAQVIMGATIDPALADRLAVTLVAARRPAPEAALTRPSAPAEEAGPPAAEFPTREAELGATRFGGSPAPRLGQRYAPPPPELSPEEAQRLLGRGRGGAGARSKAKPQQGVLPLEVVSKGRFAKSEPTLHRGEDLDTPTYVRRGMALN